MSHRPHQRDLDVHHRLDLGKPGRPKKEERSRSGPPEAGAFKELPKDAPTVMLVMAKTEPSAEPKPAEETAEAVKAESTEEVQLWRKLAQ